MTIHSSHPFAMPEDAARRFRGRLGGTVSLWTSGAGPARAGLTVSSLMVATGDPAYVVGLVDPDSELFDALETTGRGVVQLLRWRHRELAEMFAGQTPAPGGAFRHAEFAGTEWGPVLADVTSWVGVALESATELGWSMQVTCRIEHVVLGDEPDPLVHRRGRYLQR
jgi:flavin reductase (DIM6/NTAB) family NADH-FMN oxidoreductase RutF